MKKVLLIVFATMVAHIFVGCEKHNEPLYNYQVVIFQEEEKITDRDEYRVADNELYRLVNNGINEINTRFDGSIIKDESKAMSDYNEVVSLLQGLDKKFVDASAIGKDFGASEFKLKYSCILYKDGAILKKSDLFEFEYISNVRILSPEEIKINTEHAEEYSGSQNVLVAESKLNVKIVSWKLYKENGEPSNSSIIKSVKVSDDATDKTIFNVLCSAKKGVDAGKFYILVTFEDEDKMEFDLKINVTHITE